MKAAVLRSALTQLLVEDVELGRVGPHEVLIDTAAAGLCHSDLHHLRGEFDFPTPTVLGHESAGIIRQVGSEVTDFKPGDHVITCLATFCGSCERCLSGRSYLCESAVVQRPESQPPRLHQGTQKVHQFLNVSSFAEQLLVHERAVVLIDRDMPLDLAALVGCGVTTGLGAVFNAAKVGPGQSVAVIGCGGIGLSAIQGARLSGAGRIIAIDVHPNKLGVARLVGATNVLDGSAGNLTEQVRDLTHGGVDHSIEAVGLPRTASDAVEMLAVGGTATIVGLMPAGRTFPVQARLLLDDRHVQGSYMGSQNFRLAMPRYVRLYLEGKLLLEEMVSSRIGLESINAAFEDMQAGRALRDLVVF